jgi:hypothetical protein
MKSELVTTGCMLGALLLLSGCPSPAPADCQTLPPAQGGYVLRFVRAGPAAPGCDTATPSETSDLWIFDTIASSQIVVHAALSMPYPDLPAPTPPGVIGQGKFTSAQVDPSNSCQVASISTMTSGSGASLLSYAAHDMEWLAGPTYQGAEFKANVTVTAGTCTADYQVQALSPAVGCESDADCDPFKQPFSSGIFSVFDQSCKTDPWTAPIADYLGASGVCFFNQPYPSLK